MGEHVRLRVQDSDQVCSASHPQTHPTLLEDLGQLASDIFLFLHARPTTMNQVALGKTPAVNRKL